MNNNYNNGYPSNNEYPYNEFDYDLFNDFKEALEQDDEEALNRIIDEIPVNMADEDYDGMTPLMYLVEYDKPEQVQLIIDRGANVNLGSYKGITPLRYASDNVKIAKILIENGANINQTDNERYTALMSGAFHQKYDFVKLLLENGAEPNMTDNKGWTALFYGAISYSHSNIAIIKKIISILIDYGANPDIKDKKGHTVEYYLKSRKSLDSLMGYLMYNSKSNIAEHINRHKRVKEVFPALSAIGFNKEGKMTSNSNKKAMLLPTGIAAKIASYNTGLSWKPYGKVVKGGITRRRRHLKTKKTKRHLKTRRG